MKQPIWLLAFALVTTVSACGGGGGDDTIEPVVPGVVEVSLFSDTFNPADLTVFVGDTVRWVNDDDDEHTVTSGIDNADPDAGLIFGSPVLLPGDVFEVDFNDIGDFDYFCQFHVDEGMFGVVHVEP